MVGKGGYVRTHVLEGMSKERGVIQGEETRGRKELLLTYLRTLMYIHEIGKMAALPKGAAATVPLDLILVLSPSPPHGTIGCPGRKGAKCLATPILPTPGPPDQCCVVL